MDTNPYGLPLYSPGTVPYYRGRFPTRCLGGNGNLSTFRRSKSGRGCQTRLQTTAPTLLFAKTPQGPPHVTHFTSALNFGEGQRRRTLFDFSFGSRTTQEAATRRARKVASLKVEMQTEDGPVGQPRHFPGFDFGDAKALPC